MKDLVLSYMKKLKSLAILLMKSISVGLGLHPNYFLERGFINNPTILFRIFNYPKHVWEAS
jgi:isopenicillin N synthase-like dioxygenase